MPERCDGVGVKNEARISVRRRCACIHRIGNCGERDDRNLRLFRGGSPIYTVPPGETLYTDFSSGNPGTGTGTLYTPSGQSQSGDQPGSFVAAPYTATGSTTGQFFATTPGETETFTFETDVKDVGVYIGSLDAENVLILHTTSGDITYTGTELATVPGASLPGDGTPTITGSTSNGRFTFVDSAVDITGITVSESLGAASNSFEIAQITTSVPEPSIWAMMGLGFVGLAFAGYRARRAQVRVAI
jgi:PEP-CTERM motif